MVYLALDWDHPPIIEYDPPMVFYEGDGLELEATFYNDTDEEITFGLLSTDEMMVMFGLYYDGEALETNNNTTLTPEDFEIQSIYPNPFNPFTTIQFSLDLYSNVTLNLFDIRGKLVETLVDKLFQPGIHELQWNGQNYASGVYFAKLIQGGRVDVQKLMLIK